MAEETKPKKAAVQKEPKAESTPTPEAAKAADTPKAPAEGKPAKAAAKAAAAETAPAAPPPAPAAPLTASELLADDSATKKIVKIKGAKNVLTGIACILATFNNTKVTITDMQ
ncbi:MAG TPA: 30S ribosomal protein S11, partial [Candidatus Paceibacterota bacterium]|nr:30S ribosomal protein S11 [Candidatus Paceibacterota bacterium]